jgi:enoyl-CoA hydratase/carnithine racemase
VSVTTETHDRVRVISLNRPERHNALDDAALDQLEAAMSDAYADPGVDVLLLRGEGRSFCSGRDTADISDSAAGEGSEETDLQFIRRHQDIRLSQVFAAKPIVAAVKGNVLGGGLELALGADIRVGSTDLQMAFPEVHYGLTSDSGGSVLATMLAGPSRAKLMLMTGRRVDGDTALLWGLVDELVAPEDLDTTALDLCRDIASKSSSAVQVTKELVNTAWQGAVRSTMRAELFAQVALFSSAEHVALTKRFAR